MTLFATVMGIMMVWGGLALAIGAYRSAMQSHNTDTEGDTR